MAREDIADLLLRIDATTEGLRRELKRGESALNNSTKSMNRQLSALDQQFKTMGVAAQKAAKVAGVAMLGAGAALAAMAKRGIESADSLAKVSSRLGIATEDLAALRFAAEQTGVATTTLDMGLQRMTRRVAEAAQGTGEAQGAIKELGLSAQELVDLSPDQMFRRITDAMQGVGNQSDRVRLAMKLFDSEGVSLVQTMEGGTKALDEFARQARDAGLAISEVDAAKAEEAADAINRLQARFQGFTQGLAIEFAPKIVSAVEDIEKALSDPANKRAVQNFVEDGAALISWAAETAKVMGFLKDEIMAMFGVIREGDFVRLSERAENLRKAIAIDEDSILPWVRGRNEERKRELAEIEAQLERLQAAMLGLAEVTVTVTRKSEELPDVFKGSLQEIEVTAQRVSEELPAVFQQANEEVAQSTKQTTESVTSDWDRALVHTAERIDSAFADAWKGAFDSFSDFADGLKNAFRSLLGELAHLAITRPILVRMGAAMGIGGASSSAMASGGGIGGMVSGLGSGISSLGAGAMSLTSDAFAGLYNLTGIDAFGEASLTSFSRSLSMTPGMALAGAGAGLAGGYLGNQVFGPTSGIGSTLGGTVGMALGGPLGAALGSFAGSGLESLLGGDNNGDNPGRARVNLGTGAISVGGVGNTFDQANVDQVQAASDFAQQVAAAIGGSSANLDITAGRDGLRVGSRNYGQDSAAFIDRIFDNVVNQADGLSGAMKRLLTAFRGTSQQALQFAQAMVGIDRMTSSNPVSRAAQDIANAQNTAIGVYRSQVDQISTLVANFDGSAAAAQELNAALAQNQQAAYQLATAIQQISQQAEAMYTSSIQQIREATMSEEDLLASRRSQRNELFRSIASATSPEEVDRINREIIRLTEQIFQMGPQGEARADVAIRYLERSQEASQRTLDRMFENIEKSQERQNQRLQNMMQQTAQQQQRAADTMLAAAQTLASAAADFRSSGEVVT